MQYRRLGRSNLRVSEIGFGAWAIGGPVQVGSTPFGWGPVDEAAARAAIHRALDLGINFFDTADVYGMGRSEEILGEEHLHTMKAVNNLAYLYLLEENYEQAETRFDRVLAVWTQTLGENHQNTLKAINNL